MAQFNTDIVVRTLGKLDPSFIRVISKLEQVGALVDKLNKKPLNIFSKSGGVGGDIAAKQLGAFQKLTRDISNLTQANSDAINRAKLLGNTLASTAEKAQVFSQALDNVKVAGKGFAGRQTAEVKTLSRAWANATVEATKYQQRLDKLKNDALREARGLQPQGVRDVEVERRKRFVATEREKRRQAEITANEQIKQQERVEKNALRAQQKADRARAREKANRASKLSNLGAGIGFPLLFGGGPGSVIGGAVGSAGGFGGQIFASAIGGIFDAFVSELAKLGGALTKVEGLADVAAEKLLLSSKAREKELKTLQKLGFNDLADSLAKTDIENALGPDAVRNLEDLSKEFDEFGRITAQLTTSLGAFIAGPLAKLLASINGGTSLDQATKVFNVSLVREGDRRIAEQGAKTEADQIKIRQKVRKEFIDTLQRLVKAKKEELAVTSLTNSQKAEAYRQAQQELKRGPQQLEGEAAARNALAELDITQQLQSAEKTVFNIAEKYGNIQEKQQEQQANFDRQRVDIVRSYEESIAQTRENVEQRILNLRIQGIQKANEIENQRAANQLSTLQAANSAAARQQQESDIAAGTRPELAATGQTIDNAFRAIAEAELSTEQQKAQIKRDAAFEVLKLELDGEKFKIDVAKEVSRLNLNTARSIERINIGIAKRNKDFSVEKFNIEKQIASTQLEVLKQQNALLLLQIRASGAFALEQQAYEKYITGILQLIEDTQKVLETAQAPGKLTTLAPVGGESVSTAGADVALNNLLDRQRLLTEERLKGLDILKATNKEAEIAKVSQIRIDDQATINGLLTQQLDALNAQQRIIELQNEGRSEAQAVAIQQVETTFSLIDANLGVAEARLKGQLAALQAVKADQRDLDTIVKVREELEKINTLRGGLPARQQQAVENAAKLNEGLTETEQLATDVAGKLGDGITDALVLAVSGTENLGEAFQALAADILQAIGKALILAAITKAIGSIGSGNTPGTGILGDLFRAKGGPVTGNQPYIVGEKGPELFIPGVTGTVTNNDQFEAAREAMSGGTGDGVSETGGLGSEGVSSAFADNTSSISTTNSYMRERSMETNNQTTIGGAGSMTIETQVINNVEYATVEQVRLASAASAKQAKAQVFSDMKNKPAVRRKAGIK